jgi:hypothetical protein
VPLPCCRSCRRRSRSRSCDRSSSGCPRRVGTRRRPPRRRVRELAGRALGGFGERLRAGLSPGWPLASAAAGQDVEDQKRNDDDCRGDSNDRDCGGGYEHKWLLPDSPAPKTRPRARAGTTTVRRRNRRAGVRGDWPQTPPPPATPPSTVQRPTELGLPRKGEGVRRPARGTNISAPSA